MSLRDLFVDKASPEGRRMWSIAQERLTRGATSMIVRGFIVDGGSRTKTPWHARIPIKYGEDEFWRAYYAACRRVIRAYNG